MKSFSKIVVLTLSVVAVLFSNENEYYYFNPENDFGSDGMFNPVNLFLNGSYDIFRNGAHNKDLTDQPYRTGFINVRDNLRRPWKNIERYGYKNFVRREIGNFDSDVRESQFLPNIGLHVIGNGMQYVKLSEWYQHHNYPLPRILSMATTISYQMMNEILENGSFQGANVDPISDMLIFNPIGFTLFSLPAVNEFFTTTVPIYDWSPQPIITLSNLNIYNAGQQYTTKIKLKHDSKYAVFMNWGVSSVFGLSYNFAEDKSISVGAGAIVNLLKEEQSKSEDSRYMVPGIDYALGIYYDKNQSLLASLLLSGPKYYNLRMNIYPGFLKYKNISPGLFMTIGEMDKFVIGFTFTSIPIGFGL